MTRDLELRLIGAPVPDGEIVDAAQHDDEVLTLDQILASAPGPTAAQGIDLTDEEFAAFLEAARGS